MEYWQVAAGDKRRNYVHLCLRWEVILIGPGYAGPWPDCKSELVSDGRSPRKLTDIGRFCDEMHDGDVVVLRLGTDEIHGIGRIFGPYLWEEAFHDVDGWDLQHVRRVKWIWQAADSPKVFPPYTLKLGDTAQRLTSDDVKNWIGSLTVPADIGEPIRLPAAGAALAPEDIGKCLFDYGIGFSSITSIVSQISDLNRMAAWYWEYAMPSEHETVSHLSVPLFHALGWPPQRTALEWNRVDIALFRSLPRSDENLSIVVEAKKMGESCLNAASQAKDYASQDGRGSCDRLVVTDGVRYGVYQRRPTGQFPVALDAYLNLEDPRDSYPVLGCDGGHKAMLMMSSGWMHQARPTPLRQSIAPEEV